MFKYIKISIKISLNIKNTKPIIKKQRKNKLKTLINFCITQKNKEIYFKIIKDL